MKLVKTKNLKNYFRKNEDKVVLIIGIILIALISFGAGRLMVVRQPKEPIKIEDYGLASLKESMESQTNGSTPLTINSGEEESIKERMFVGSINSNKYHLPDCQWAKIIKPENRIWFKSAEDAKSQGYIPSSCVKERNG